jgi:hypothetical protein
MNPGYIGRCVPYFSPIHVTRVTPLKTSKGILEIDFWNVCYAEGVQNFAGMRLKILLRAENYSIAHLQGSGSEVRSAIVSHREDPAPVRPVVAGADSSLHGWTAFVRI